MGMQIKQPEWEKVEYSRKRIERAGKEIISGSISDEEKKEAVAVIDNWRAAHAYPLHYIYMNLKKYAVDDKNIIVAQRLKRLDSIVDKLKRFSTMNLWKMQDLGGCRVIVSEIGDVYKYRDKFKNSRIRHILKKENDYISSPRTTGYRSLHMVYEYHSDSNDEYNRHMLIEIQFRTHLQHLWATAVETMGLFTNVAIKSGRGSEEVNRFFALISSLFAMNEGCPIVPGTPEDMDEIIHEVESLNARNNYLGYLSGIRVATKQEEDNVKYKDNERCVLSLDYDKHELSIKRFKPSDISLANEYNNKLENQKGNDRTDNVLVRVSSFARLREAYPNYFADIGEFVGVVKGYLK